MGFWSKIGRAHGRAAGFDGFDGFDGILTERAREKLDGNLTEFDGNLTEFDGNLTEFDGN